MPSRLDAGDPLEELPEIPEPELHHLLPRMLHIALDEDLRLIPACAGWVRCNEPSKSSRWGKKPYLGNFSI